MVIEFPQLGQLIPPVVIHSARHTQGNLRPFHAAKGPFNLRNQFFGLSINRGHGILTFNDQQSGFVSAIESRVSV